MKSAGVLMTTKAVSISFFTARVNGGRLTFSAREEPKIGKNLSVELGNRRLSRARIAQEDFVETELDQRLLVQFPRVVVLDRVKERLDRVLDGRETDQFLKLGPRSIVLECVLWLGSQEVF